MKNLSPSSKDYLKQILLELMSFNDVEVLVPEKHQAVLSYHPTLKKVSKVVQSVDTLTNASSAA